MNAVPGRHQDAQFLLGREPTQVRHQRRRIRLDGQRRAERLHVDTQADPANVGDAQLDQPAGDLARRHQRGVVAGELPPRGWQETLRQGLHQLAWKVGVKEPDHRWPARAQWGQRMLDHGGQEIMAAHLDDVGLQAAQQPAQRAAGTEQVILGAEGHGWAGDGVQRAAAQRCLAVRGPGRHEVTIEAP